MSQLPLNNKTFTSQFESINVLIFKSFERNLN